MHPRTILLQDEPAKSDAFGSHETIAKSIQEIILSENKKKAIALVGGRGSGKSTVISLLEGQLSFPDRNNVGVFIYDAWSHSGDPLRRSFLEELHSFLKNKNWIQPEGKWQIELERLSRRREDTNKFTTPIFTSAAYLFALAALLLPIGYGLIGSSEKDPVFFALPNKWLGLGFTGAPILAAIIIWLLWRPERNIISKKFWKAIFSKSFWTTNRGGKSIFGLFVNRTIEEDKSTTIKTAEPTSVEFQDIFMRIVQDAIGLCQSKRDARKRLVIVIDNLDRVPEEEARKIWSTMRAFFDISTNKICDGWFERFSLIVPFAPTMPQEIWKSEKPANAGSIDESESFIEKTFQAVFCVPPPLLVRWKDYFLKNLNEAFPDEINKEDEFNAIYRMCDMKGFSGKTLPTPRDIKVFINMVGAYHRIWKDKIPLHVQALYVLHRKDITPCPEVRLTDEAFPDKKIINLIKVRDWQKYLAALHFNVSSEDALHVLLGRQLREALESGDSDKIEAHSKVHGFPSALIKTIDDYGVFWAENSPIQLGYALYALSSLIGQDTHEMREIKDLFHKNIQRVKAWDGMDEICGKGVRILYEDPSDQDSESAEILLNALAKTHATKTPFEDDRAGTKRKERVAAFLRGVCPILDILSKKTSIEKINSIFRVAGNAELYLSVIYMLATLPEFNHLISYFKPIEPPEWVVKQIADQVSLHKSFNESSERVVGLLLTMPVEWKWEPFIEQAVNRLMAGSSGVTKIEMLSLMKCLLRLFEKYNDESLKKKMEALCSDGHLYHHTYEVGREDEDLRALCVMFFLRFIPNGQVRQLPGGASRAFQKQQELFVNPASNIGVIKKYASLLLEYAEVNGFIKIVKSNASLEKFSGHVFQELMQSTQLPISPALMMDNFLFFKKVIQNEVLEAYIHTLTEQKQMVRMAKESKFKIEEVALHVFILKSESAIADATYIKFLIDGLCGVSQLSWEAALLAEDDLLQLLFLLEEKSLIQSLDIGFAKALLAHAEKILTGSVYPKACLENWAKLLNVMNPTARVFFLQDLRDNYILSNPAQEKIKLLNLYGQALLGGDIFNETDDSSDRTVRSLFCKILDRKNESEIDWLMSSLKGYPKILKRSKSAGVLKQHLLEKRGDAQTSASIKERYDSIAEFLGGA